LSFIELFILAIGLSMDAFAISICAGLTMEKVNTKKALIVGAYFGIFQAGMPLVGYLVASLFAQRILAYGDWIAFAVLAFLGGKMLFDSFKKNNCSADGQPSDQCCSKSCPSSGKNPGKEQSLKLAAMLPLAIATSIDALAVGASFAVMQVNIVSAIVFIGITTLVVSMVGVKIGNVFGVRFRSKAQFAGGVILVLMGASILLEHLGILKF